MSSIALLSVKGSPGVTTTALALGAVWPQPRRALVAELDPAGGDVAMWAGLPGEPNIVTLAAATGGTRARAGERSTRLHPVLVLKHSQRPPGGPDVLTSPPGSVAVVRSALGLLGTRSLLEALDQPAGVDLVADLGRLVEPESPALAAVEAATMTAVVVRPTHPALRRRRRKPGGIEGDLEAAALAHVQGCVADLARRARRLVLLLVGESGYPEREIAAVLGIETRAVPFDARSAAALAGGKVPVERLARRPLLRAARSLAQEVVELATAPVEQRNAPTQPEPAFGGLVQ